MERADLGASGFVRVEGARGETKEDPRRGGDPLFIRMGEKDPRQPFRSRARSKPVPFVCRSTSGPDTFANRGLSTFTGGLGHNFLLMT